jgi:hypothetical protein
MEFGKAADGEAEEARLAKAERRTVDNRGS